MFPTGAYKDEWQIRKHHFFPFESAIENCPSCNKRMLFVCNEFDDDSDCICLHCSSGSDSGSESACGGGAAAGGALKRKAECIDLT